MRWIFFLCEACWGDGIQGLQAHHQQVPALQNVHSRTWQHKDKPVPQYETIRRLQKQYLVRCGEPLENVIPGNGVKPVSQIRRIEGQIKQLRQELGKIAQEELLVKEDTSNENKGKLLAELEKRGAELTDKITDLQKQLLEAELL